MNNNNTFTLEFLREKIDLLLNQFLVHLSLGGSLSNFITGNVEAERTIDTIMDSISEELNELSTEVDRLNSELELAQGAPSASWSDKEAIVRDLLVSALNKLNEDNEQLEEEIIIEERVVEPAVPVRPVRVEEPVATEIHVEESVTDDDLTDILDILGDIFDYEDDEDEDYDDDDDEDDEVYHTTFQAQAHSSNNQFLKHPNITENWTELENASMRLFIFAKYSHLPFHYSLGETNYKLVPNGSDIIAIVV